MLAKEAVTFPPKVFLHVFKWHLTVLQPERSHSVSPVQIALVNGVPTVPSESAL